jgi:hypothetical protein
MINLDNLGTGAEPVSTWTRMNLWDRIAPNHGLSDKDLLLLGPLADIQTYTTEPGEIFSYLYEVARKMDRSNPTAAMKTLCGLDRCYELLVEAGFESFRPEREQMQIGLRRFCLTVLKSLTRDMLSTDDDEKAEEISQFLIEVITKGQWTRAEFTAEYECWVAEMQARRAC